VRGQIDAQRQEGHLRGQIDDRGDQFLRLLAGAVDPIDILRGVREEKAKREQQPGENGLSPEKGTF